MVCKFGSASQEACRRCDLYCPWFSDNHETLAQGLRSSQPRLVSRYSLTSGLSPVFPSLRSTILAGKRGPSNSRTITTACFYCLHCVILFVAWDRHHPPEKEDCRAVILCAEEVRGVVLSLPHRWLSGPARFYPEFIEDVGLGMTVHQPDTT
jgi:hypothetical protein